MSSFLFQESNQILTRNNYSSLVLKKYLELGLLFSKKLQDGEDLKFVTDLFQDIIDVNFWLKMSHCQANLYVKSMISKDLKIVHKNLVVTFKFRETPNLKKNELEDYKRENKISRIQLKLQESIARVDKVHIWNLVSKNWQKNILDKTQRYKISFLDHLSIVENIQYGQTITEKYLKEGLLVCKNFDTIDSKLTENTFVNFCLNKNIENLNLEFFKNIEENLRWTLAKCDIKQWLLDYKEKLNTPINYDKIYKIVELEWVMCIQYNHIDYFFYEPEKSNTETNLIFEEIVEYWLQMTKKYLDEKLLVVVGVFVEKPNMIWKKDSVTKKYYWDASSEEIIEYVRSLIPIHYTCLADIYNIRDCWTFLICPIFAWNITVEQSNAFKLAHGILPEDL